MKNFWGVLSFFLLLVSAAWSRPVDLSAPDNELGAANVRGYLEIWCEVDQIDLDKGLSLPLRYKFTSEPGSSGMLGEGFWCPLLEARAILIREQMMRAYLLCGKGLYLRRDPANKNRFQTLDKEWVGIQNGDTFVVSREDGWTLRYRQGKLVSLRTDQGREITWIYIGNNKWASEIQENGVPFLKVETDSLGQAAALAVNGLKHTLDFDKRPHFSLVRGKAVVEGTDRCLTGWNFPDGKREVFEFPKGTTTLTFTDQDKQKTVYQWDDGTGHLKSEGDWKYEIGQVKEKFELPTVSRINSRGEKEQASFDNKSGVYTTLDSDGIKTVTYTFKSPGPLYQKVQKVERVEKGKVTVIYKAAYDELGKLIRKTDEKGFTTNYQYGANDKVVETKVTPPSDPEILASLKAREKILLKKVAEATNEETVGDALQELAFFYINDVGDPAKAMALLPKVTNRLQLFNIQLCAIERNFTTSPKEKVAQLEPLLESFPERRKLLETIITARKKDADDTNSN